MDTWHELKINDRRGKIRIIARIYAGNYSIGNQFSVRVWHAPPKKRTESINEDIATEEEKLLAMTQLWEKIKPTEIKYH